jgi:hypothetical protein
MPNRLYRSRDRGLQQLYGHTSREVLNRAAPHCRPIAEGGNCESHHHARMGGVVRRCSAHAGYRISFQQRRSMGARLRSGRGRVRYHQGFGQSEYMSHVLKAPDMMRQEHHSVLPAGSSILIDFD